MEIIGLDFHMKNTDCAYLLLYVQTLHSMDNESSTLKVKIHNCTIGNWQFENIAELNIHNCSTSGPNPQIAITIYNSTALSENVNITEVEFVWYDDPGIFISSGSYVVIKDSIFSRNIGYTTSLIYASDGSTVIMEYCNLTENIWLFANNDTIHITKNSTFKILRSYYAQSKSFANIFAVNDVWVYAEYTEFVSNTAVGMAGAIGCQQNCTLDIGNCNFTENGVLRGDLSDISVGGAIGCQQNCILDISDCSFTGNEAFRKNLSDVIGDLSVGGAIGCLHNCTLDTSNCNFTGNKAFHGGGISIEGPGNVRIVQSTFHNNSAGPYGGAVVVSKYITAHLSEVIFTENRGTYYGGAFASHEFCDVLVCNCYFRYNIARGLQKGIYDIIPGYGGGIAVLKNNTVNVVNTTFIQNEGFHSGGTIFGIDNCWLEIFSYLIDSNSDRAVMAFDCIVANVLNSEFRNNSGEYGGAIAAGRYEVITELNASKVVFLQNRASCSGGAILTSKGRISHCVFNNNYAPCDAGAVYLPGSDQKRGTHAYVYLTDNTIDNNTANLGKGGSVTVEGGELIMVNCSIHKSQAESGGAMYLESSIIIIINSTFKRNFVRLARGGSTNLVAGGAIMSKDSQVHVNHSLFSENYAFTSGAIYFDGDKMIMLNVTIFNNSAQQFGAMSVNTSIIAELTDRRVSYNTAPQYSGGIYIAGIFVAINSTFAENVGTDSGSSGCIYMFYNTLASSEECTLKGNRGHFVGAISAASHLKISKTRFINNTAKYGQDIFFNKINQRLAIYLSTSLQPKFIIRRKEEHFTQRAFKKNVIFVENKTPKQRLDTYLSTFIHSNFMLRTNEENFTQRAFKKNVTFN